MRSCFGVLGVPLLCGLAAIFGCEKKQDSASTPPGRQFRTAAEAADAQARAHALGLSLIRELTAALIELDDSFRPANEIYNIAKARVVDKYRDDYLELAKSEGASAQFAEAKLNDLLEDNRNATVATIEEMRLQGETADLGKTPFDKPWIIEQRVVTRPWAAAAYLHGVALLEEVGAADAAKQAIDATAADYRQQLRQIILERAAKDASNQAEIEEIASVRLQLTEYWMTRQLRKFFSIVEQRRSAAER